MKTIVDVFSTRLKHNPRRIACYWLSQPDMTWQSLNWFEIHKLSSQLKRHLANTLEPGQRVALLLENSPAFLVASHFVLSCGGIVIPVNPQDSRERLVYILDETQPVVIFTHSEFDCVLKDQISETHQNTLWMSLTTGGELLEPQLLGHSTEQKTTQKILAADAAFLVYTSGSTGAPKGVVYSHKHVLTNIEQIQGCLPAKSSDVFCSVQHPAYSFELIVAILLPIVVGARVVFAARMRNLQHINDLQPSILVGTPHVLQNLIARVTEKHSFLFEILQKNKTFAWAMSWFMRRQWKKLLGSSFRLFVCGGASISTSLRNKANAISLPWIFGYGMTEAGPVVSLNTNKFQDGSVGKIVDGMDWKVSGDGELLLKAETVVTKYYRGSNLKDEQEYFQTGDLGTVDNDGRLVLRGRKDSAIQLLDGKIINAESLEQQIVSEDAFDHAVVVGAGRSSLTAVVFLSDWYIQSVYQDRLVQNSVSEIVMIRVRLASKGSAHAGKIEKVIVAASSSIEEAWQLSNGKLNRNLIIEKFRHELDDDAKVVLTFPLPEQTPEQRRYSLPAHS